MTATRNETDSASRKLAGYASQAGSFFANDPNGDSAAAMARGMATSAATEEVQNWLNRFGTARVRLSANEDFSLDDSELDLLIPLYDRGNNMAFTQGSVHRTDDRTQANLGFGMRHFADGYMLGANIFGDYDISRQHARLGAGLEYWRDYLKVGVNGYKRLTDWKDSPDLDDYEERPADGWDVRLQGWLPAYPQLGGKLVYEQYYGDEVGLFGADDLQKNPHAVTAGVTYTPFPLMTVSLDHRQGQSGEKDTQVALDVNYQLGVPWRKQLDSDAVADMRTLSGSRYDLVERNNNIVLQYRKKELLRLRTAELVTGHAGEKKSLGVSVTSKYGVERIDWSAPELLAAGGIIGKAGDAWGVKLPAWKSGKNAVNTYSVAGVAVDTKGNRSEKSVSQVTVLKPALSARNSSFTPLKSTLPADGKSTQVLTLLVRDDANKAVDIDTSEITLTTSPVKSARLSGLAEKETGTYELTVTAGKDAEVINVTPKIAGVSLPTATIVINSLIPDAHHSSFTASPDRIPADNATTSVLTFRAGDAQGGLITGVADRLSFVAGDAKTRKKASAEALSVSEITESDAGIYTATVKGSKAMNTTFVPLFDNARVGELKAPLTLTATAPAELQSAIAVDKPTYAAGGTIQVTVSLKDASGNPVAGYAGELTDSTVKVPNATLTGKWTDNNNGTYSAAYKAETAGSNLKATLKLSAWSKAVESDAYGITATAPDQAQSSVAVDKPAYKAGDAISVTVTLKDKTGNIVAGAADALTDTTVKVQNAKPAGQWTDNGDGTYAATYTALTAGTGLKATLQLEGWSQADESDAYVITAGDAVAEQSAIAVDKPAYAAGDTIAVTVTLKDTGSNGVTGKADVLTDSTVKVPNASLTGQWTDNKNGTYSAAYKAETAGSNLKATLKLSGWNKTVESDAYGITATAPDQAQSAITVDKPTYKAGDAISVTVTLKDKAGNVVTGAADALTDTTVHVQNAKPAGQWTDNGDGTYAAAYTALTAGTGLKATLKLDRWSQADESAAYDIVAGDAVAGQSAIAVDKPAYAAGDTIAVTVTLKDTGSNAVTGKADVLTDSTVKVPNASLTGQWTDNKNGTYSAAYKAETAGSNLKATLQLEGWSQADESDAYGITATAPDQAQSSIAVDKPAYKAGDVISVTVTLKDKAGNIVAGAADALTDTTVKVQNAKPAGQWTDNGDGTYAATYTALTAGTGLKATLQLEGWSQADESDVYAITAGDAVAEQSAIAVDKPGYAAGEAIQVTVTLKDTGSNAVTGKADALTDSTVKVPNASLSGQWTDNGDGTYSAAYTAQTPGTDLKATLQLEGWSQADESDVYAITAGDAVAGQSSIAVDKPAYTAGDAISVTITLKDKAGNIVAGAADALTDATVKVQNAKPAGEWTDNGDGTYAATYTARTAGTGLKATLQLEDWSKADESDAYDVVAGDAVAEQSAIAVDKPAYAAGETIAVTVTLKDTGSNGVTGKADALTDSTVKVPNASLSGQWTDNGDGTYSAAYTAQTPGTDLKATLQLEGWSKADESEVYAISAAAAAAAQSTITVAKSSYTAGQDVKVIVHLNDESGNAVSGAVDSLNDNTVTVPGTSGLTGDWTESGNGIYEATYQAHTAGTNLTATLKLKDWSDTVESERSYEIIADRADLDNSELTVDKDTYEVGEEIHAKAIIKDHYGNKAELDGITQTSCSSCGSQIPGSDAGNWIQWTKASDGVYTVTVKAAQPGTDYEAEITSGDTYISPEIAELHSNKYAVTAGSPVAEQSAIKVDKTSYNSGETIKVTVSLKDASGNAVAGQTDALTEDAVKVSGAATFTGTWSDSGDGTYTAEYTAKTAGTGLKATLQLSGWSKANESGVYDITAGDAVVEASAIKVDKKAYKTGETIDVTVTLIDAENNAVAGAAQELTDKSVKVEGAAAFTDTWTDNGDGTYSASYIAQTPGTDLKATLQLEGWSKADESEVYAITAAAAAAAQSTITVAKSSYTAGQDVKVIVHLNDESGNAVSGAVDSLNDNTVTVPGTSGLTGDWTESGNGTYEATYQAHTAGTNLTATLKLKDWSDTVESERSYEIIADRPDFDNSELTVDKDTYEEGEEIHAKATLKDHYGNKAELEGLLNHSGCDSCGSQIPGSDAGNWIQWTKASDGVYTVTVKAAQPGTDYEAEITSAETYASNGEVIVAELHSNKYEVSAGSPVAEQSAIKVDKTSYNSGDDIKVTITLLSEKGTGVTGQRDNLQSRVTVPGSKADNGVWVESAGGVYTRTYVAETTGTGLKASVKYDDWAEAVQSEEYAIKTVPVADNSTIAVDKSSYVAGDVITATLTLRDANNLPVTGQIEDVQQWANNKNILVANAELTGEWTEKGDGVYTGTYTAETAGAVKATLKAPSWSTTKSSGIYEITAGAPDQSESTITAGKSKFTAGEYIQPVVTLKDKYGNVVTGMSKELTASAVTIPGASGSTSPSFKDNGDGTYQSLNGYVAVTAISGYYYPKLQLEGWTSPVKGSNYSIVAAEASAKHTVVKMDQDTYYTGAASSAQKTMAVTITFKDNYDNVATVDASTVPVTIPGSGGGTYNASKSGNGYYVTAQTGTAGKDYKATTTISGWTEAAESEPYDVLNIGIKELAVNDYTVKADAGFPTTGFNGAKFTIVMDEGSRVSDYKWSSNQSWVSVDSKGVVTFKGTGNGNSVTITGSRSGSPDIQYTFKLNSWYINNGYTDEAHWLNWSDTNDFCTQSGAVIPTIMQLTADANGKFGQGAVGSLLGEWGHMDSYPGSNFAWGYYWAADQKSDGSHIYTDFGTGGIYTDNTDDYKHRPVCRIGL
ncbi:invasin domain 3-containing protein [Enterobacter mori]|uniref:invasin domain 3-containing protein n=1 Tax=Enterobacter mori TaxID=539813 RepID=UPI00398B046B